MNVQGKSTNSNLEKVRFFVPGEVFFLVEHKKVPMESDDLRTSLGEILRRLEPEIRERLENPEPFDSLLTILENEGALRNQTLVHHAFEGWQEVVEGDLEENLLDIPAHFSFVTASLKQQARVSDEDLINMLIAINETLPQISEDDSSGAEAAVFLHGLIPNWLCAGAQGQLVVGGPGARPTSRTEAVAVDEARFDLKDARFGAGDGAGVTVVILDTLLDDNQSERAAHDFSDRHPLVRSLLSADAPPGRRLQRRRYKAMGAPSDVMKCYPKNDRRFAELYATLGHETYLMVDHGLFVAGIVRGIASEAEVRIIETLNCYGVGSINTLIDAILQLWQDWPTGKVVVNCSLTFVLPDPQYREARPQLLELVLQWMWLEGVLGKNPLFIQLINSAIHWLFGILRARGAAIVAAAGNEGGNDIHPPARMPAADNTVLGVGAVDEAGTWVDYSNRGDTPLCAGILTYGGTQRPDDTAVGDIDGEDHPTNKGILGVFTHSYPERKNPRAAKPNVNGWGYWAGTSFAAPIVSAALAILMGQGETASGAIKFLRDIITNDESDEDIFPVTQGPTT